MIRRFLLALLIAFAATAPVRAETASKLEEILARGILRVGLTGDYRPFSTLDKSTNQYSGIDVDMAGALAAALGVKLVIVPTTWHDILADIGSGQFDIGMGGVAVTLDRQKRAFYSTPVMRAGVTAIAHCSARSRYRDLRDIDRAGTRVVVNAGSASENFVRANLKNAQATVITDRAGYSRNWWPAASM